MIETFTALLLAHVLTDFAAQPRSMVDAKAARRPAALGLHGAIGLALSAVCLGTFHWALVALALAHVAIDLAKTLLPATFWSFCADQAAHLVTLAAVALLWPELWAGGLWSGGWTALPGGAMHWPALPWLPPVMALVAGGLIAVRAGGFAVGLLMREHAGGAPQDGLPKGGATIGVLERALVFMLVLVGQPGGVGFLIAAKSVLRFSATSSDRSASEYVIIGTLASFGWAMATAWATVALLSHLYPIGIPPGTP